MESTTLDKGEKGGRTWQLWLGVGLVAAGVAVAAQALVAGYRAKDAVFSGEVTCDGAVMRPGDGCVAFGGGNGGSYAEMLEHARNHSNDDLWHYAEFTGTVGIILLLAGLTVTLLARRFSIRTRVAVLGTAAVALVGYALAVWPAHEQVREASPVAVGFLGGQLDFAYGPLAIGLLVLLCLVPVSATLADGWGEQKEKAEAAVPQPRTRLDDEVERSLRTMRERQQRRAERD